MKKLLISSDIIAFYKIAPTTFKRWIDDGLPHTKVGNAYIFEYEEVEKFVNIDDQVYPRHREFIKRNKLASKLGLSSTGLDSFEKVYPLPYYERYDNTIVYDAYEIIEYFEKEFCVTITEGVKPLWNTNDICSHYKVSKTTAKLWMKQGAPRFKINSKQSLYNPKEFDKWVLGDGKETTIGKELITAQEVSKEYFCSQDVVRKRANFSTLKHYVLRGWSYRFTWDDVEKFIDEGVGL